MTGLMSTILDGSGGAHQGSWAADDFSGGTDIKRWRAAEAAQQDYALGLVERVHDGLNGQLGRQQADILEGLGQHAAETN